MNEELEKAETTLETISELSDCSLPELERIRDTGRKLLQKGDLNLKDQERSAEYWEHLFDCMIKSKAAAARNS